MNNTNRSYWSISVAAIVGSTLGSPASAQTDVDWSGYTPAAIDNEESIYLVRDIDYNRIGPETKNGQFWLLVDHTDDVSVNARSSMVLITVDCPARSYRITQEVSYSKSGKVTNSIFKTSYSSTIAVPGSIIGVTIEYACIGYNQFLEELRE